MKDEPHSGKTQVTNNLFNAILCRFCKLFTLGKNQKNKGKGKSNGNGSSATIRQGKKILLKSQEFLKNFESFSSKTVHDVMVPRSDIIAVSYDTDLEQFCKVIVKHNHTRTLVYKENLDNIIGFVHIKDLFSLLTKSKKFSMKDLLRKNLVSPISMRLTDLLTQMQLKRTHIAVVVDEYGGTDGIVTIEDIMEAIVGRIDDEHDDIDVDGFKVIKSGVVITSARVEVERIEKELGIKLKTEGDEFDTIGGLVLSKSGNIPAKGDIVEIDDGVVVEILDSTTRTIKQLKITSYAKDSSEKDIS